MRSRHENKHKNYITCHWSQGASLLLTPDNQNNPNKRCDIFLLKQSLNVFRGVVFRDTHHPVWDTVFLWITHRWDTMTHQPSSPATSEGFSPLIHQQGLQSISKILRMTFYMLRKLVKMRTCLDPVRHIFRKNLFQLFSVKISCVFFGFFSFLLDFQTK